MKYGFKCYGIFASPLVKALRIVVMILALAGFAFFVFASVEIGKSPYIIAALVASFMVTFLFVCLDMFVFSGLTTKKRGDMGYLRSSINGPKMIATGLKTDLILEYIEIIVGILLPCVVIMATTYSQFRFEYALSAICITASTAAAAFLCKLISRQIVISWDAQFALMALISMLITSFVVLLPTLVVESGNVCIGVKAVVTVLMVALSIFVAVMAFKLGYNNFKSGYFDSANDN